MNPNNSKTNKVLNRNAILKMLALNAPISRIELANNTGLSKMSLTNIISEFSKLGYIKESGVDITSTGKKKPTLLAFADHCLCAIGINLTRDFIEGCICDIKGNIIKTEKIILDEGTTRQTIIDSLKMIISNLRKRNKYEILGIGIASVGPVDSINGIILNPTNFFDISNLNILEPLKNTTDIPVFVRKNNDCAILAERYYGIAKEVKNAVYLGISKGVGSSVMVDDKIITGYRGYANEIGHTTVNAEGGMCKCGNRGCLELYANTEVVCRKVAEKMPDTGKIKFNDAAMLALRGNPAASEAMDDFCKYVSIAITNMVKLYDTELVILGSTIATAGNEILSSIKAEVSDRTGFTNIKLSKFKENAPLIGAATAVFDSMFFSNINAN